MLCRNFTFNCFIIFSDLIYFRQAWPHSQTNVKFTRSGLGLVIKFLCKCPLYALYVIGVGGGGGGGYAPPKKKKKWKRKIRAKTIENSGKSNGKLGEDNGKFGEKQWFLPEIWYATAFRVFPLLLPEFPIPFARIFHCFCPNSPLLFPEIRAKAMENCKSNEKTRKAAGYRPISGKNYGSFGQFLELTYYF